MSGIVGLGIAPSKSGAIDGRTNHPVALFERQSNQSIANTTDTKVDWDTVIHARGGISESSGDITLQRSGLYLIFFNTRWENWAGSSSHYVQSSIQNSSNQILFYNYCTAFAPYQGINVSGIWEFAAGATFSCKVSQGAGSTQNLSGNTSHVTNCYITFLF